MATASFTTPSSPLTMATLAAFLDAALGELRNGHRGASAPDSPVEGQRWWDTSGGATAEILKRYTAAAGWVSLLTMNVTTGTITAIHGILDEDNMASNSAVLPVSQQSALAYFMAKTGANLAIGSDADGDMYYRASSVLARLAKGTARQHILMNAGATAPEWKTPYKIGTFTRNLTAANGDVSITGVGFKPTHIIFTGALYQGSIGFGFDDGTNHYCTFSAEAATPQADTTHSIFAGVAAAYQFALVKTLDTDGFTLTWEKTGSPSGTATIHYMAF